MTNTLRILWVLLVIGWGCSSQPDTDLQTADQLLAQGKLNEAIAHYQKAMAKERSAGVLKGLGYAQLLSGLPEKAIEHLLEAKKASPDDVMISKGLSISFALTGKTSEARNEALHIIDKHPEIAFGQLLSAALAETPSQRDQAIAELNKVIEGTKERLASLPKAEIELALADLYQRKNDIAAAKRFLDRNKDSKIDNPLDAMQLASIYIRLRKYIPAERLLQKIGQNHPKFTPAWGELSKVSLELKHYRLADLALSKLPKEMLQHQDFRLIQSRYLLSQNKPKEALSILKKGLAAIKPEHRKEKTALALQLFIAQAFYDMKDNAAAQKALKPLLTADYFSSSARFLSVKIDIRLKEYNRAIAELKKMVAEPENRTHAVEILGELYLKMQKFQDAIALYQQQVNQSPKDAKAIHALATALRLAGKKELAIEAFKKALKVRPQSTGTLMSLIDIAMKDGQPKVAEQYLTQQIKLLPQSVAHRIMAGDFYLKQGKSGKAIDAYKTAVKLDSRNIVAHTKLADIYFKNHQPVIALYHFNQLLDINPKNVAALQYAAQLEMTAGKKDRAIKRYEELLSIKPEDVIALNNLAQLYSESSGALEKAFQYAKKASQLAPDSPPVADTLGWVLYKRRKYNEAIAYVSRASEALSENAEAMFHLGMAQLATNQKKEGLATLRKALRLATDFGGNESAGLIVAMSSTDPEMASRYQQVLFSENPESAERFALEGSFYQKRSDRIGAENAFKKAIELDSNDVESLNRLGEIYYETNRPALALEALKGVLKKQPNNLEVLEKVAMLESNHGKKERAIEYCLRLIQKKPDHFQALINLGRFYSEAPVDLQKALRFASKAREIAPNNAQAADALGWVFYQKKEFDKALPLLEKAAAELRQNASVHYHLGMTYLAMQKREQGIASLRQAVNIAPTFEGAEKVKKLLSANDKNQKR